MTLLHIALQVVMAISGTDGGEIRAGIWDVMNVVHEGNVIEELDVEGTIRLVSVICFCESGFRSNVVGFDGLGTYGVMQISDRWAKKEILFQRKENIKIGIKLLNDLKKSCGSLHKGLGAYMTGKCGAIEIASQRCLLAGLDRQCRIRD